MAKGYLQIILTVALWAFTSSLMVRLIDQPPQVILSLACLSASIFFLGKIGIQKRISEIKVPKKYLLWLIFGVGVAQGINVLLFWTAVKTTTIANANFSHYFAPVLVALVFAPLILKEPIKLQTIIASMAGLAGLGFIFFFGSPLSLDPGIIFGLASALFFAILVVSERKLALTGAITPEVDTIFKAGIPALIFLPYAIIHIIGNGITLYALGMIILLGLIQQGLCNFLLFRGLKTVSARHASFLMYGEPVIAALLIGPIFLNEKLDWLVIVGGCLIVGAGILIARASKSLLEKLEDKLRESEKILYWGVAIITTISLLLFLHGYFVGGMKLLFINFFILLIAGFSILRFGLPGSIFVKVALPACFAGAYMSLLGILAYPERVKGLLYAFFHGLYNNGGLAPLYTFQEELFVLGWIGILAILLWVAGWTGAGKSEN